MQSSLQKKFYKRSQEMSADIDDSCQNCEGGRMAFKTEEVEGHSKRHRVGTCKKCGEVEVISGCEGC